jgi:hypothetical protein
LVTLYKVAQCYEHNTFLCHCFIRIKAPLSVFNVFDLYELALDSSLTT